MESAFEGHLHCPKSSKINDAYFHMDTSHAASGTFQTASQGLFDQFLSRPRVVLHLLPIGIHQACGTHVQQIGVAFMHELTWLLLDSGVVDVTMSYNAICTSRIILEGIVFQELYKRVEP